METVSVDCLKDIAGRYVGDMVSRIVLKTDLRAIVGEMVSRLS